MSVRVAASAGFCFGVDRAVGLVEQTVREGKRAVTLGPIIHNHHVVQHFAALGVREIASPEEVPGGSAVIIRSHGVGPAVYDEAKARGLEVVDATCPHVKKAQLSAKELVDEGYSVVIIGEKEHPEVKSIFEWSSGKAQIIETEDEAEAIEPCGKLGIVCQTTFSGARFRQIVMRLLEKSRDIRILRTICTATDQRQAAAIDLASKVDLMLVIGGKNSANTTRLAQLCSEKCLTYHIETAAELQDEWFDKIKKIGITAGASTPDWIIKEVYKKCQNR